MSNRVKFSEKLSVSLPKSEGRKSLIHRKQKLVEIHHVSLAKFKSDEITNKDDNENGDRNNINESRRMI